VRDVLIAGGKPRYTWRQEAVAAGHQPSAYQKAVHRLCGKGNNFSVARKGRTVANSKLAAAKQLILSLIASGCERRQWVSKSRAEGISDATFNQAVIQLRAAGVPECAAMWKRAHATPPESKQKKPSKAKRKHAK
jgi:hypothetical protein